MNKQLVKLHDLSIQIIINNQTENGAYIASPNFETYHYCWFRDGAYIAYSMNLVGKHESAERFHNWSAARIMENEGSVESAIYKAKAGLPLDANSILHTRYHLNGIPEDDSIWPNFQLDGFGTWLWSLEEFCKITGKALKADWRKAADLTANYLMNLWSKPCYDCWEEYPEYIHPSTLAAIYGGLSSYKRLGGRLQPNVLVDIQKKIIRYSEKFGYITKFYEHSGVDANLITLSVPYQVLDVDHPAMLATIEEIEKTIGKTGGLHRYVEDTYYGGGEWLILTCWLGWYKTVFAKKNQGSHKPMVRDATRLLQWTAKYAGIDSQLGWLPEQVSINMNYPSFYQEWVNRWGKSANPLLWSHAMYIILFNNLITLDPSRES
jgi:GH15 family glucan-1,4-alpha-glucosidase